MLRSSGTLAACRGGDSAARVSSCGWPLVERQSQSRLTFSVFSSVTPTVWDRREHNSAPERMCQAPLRSRPPTLIVNFGAQVTPQSLFGLRKVVFEPVEEALIRRFRDSRVLHNERAVLDQRFGRLQEPERVQSTDDQGPQLARHGRTLRASAAREDASFALLYTFKSTSGSMEAMASMRAHDVQDVVPHFDRRSLLGGRRRDALPDH